MAGDLVAGGSTSPSVTTLTTEPSDWEPYEGALVRLDGLQITADADSYGESATTWSLVLDDFLYDYDLTYGAGDRFTSVTGIVRYSFDTWRLCPRTDADFAR